MKFLIVEPFYSLFSSPLGPNISLRILFSNTLYLYTHKIVKPVVTIAEVRQSLKKTNMKMTINRKEEGRYEGKY